MWAATAYHKMIYVCLFSVSRLIDVVQSIRSRSMSRFSLSSYPLVPWTAAFVVGCAAALFVRTAMAQSGGWSCVAGGGNKCAANIGAAATCGGGGSGLPACESCVDGCAADTRGTQVCAAGANPKTCAAVSRACNAGNTTEWCGCNFVCGCVPIGCFPGPCIGASAAGTYQYDCQGV